MKLNKLSLKYQYLFLGIIILLGFLVRLYRFDGPVADWHSWRQADTSSVSRDFVNKGINFLHPTYDDLSNVPSGVFDNPNGYRFVEFPIYNALQALPAKFIGILTLEEWGRLVSIFASLVSSFLIFLLIKKRFGNLAGFFASFFFLFIPFNIYYSRTILPDPLMISFTLGAIYFFEKWIEEPDKKNQLIHLLISFFLILTAFLIKPYALFFVFPIVFLAFEKYGKKAFKIKKLWAYAILSVIPLLLWRQWILQYPAGIPQSAWLLNGNGIRFRPSFFYWIFYERIAKLILGFFGIPILLAPILNKFDRKEYLYVGSFVLSCALYVSILATGNVQHDYYQILIVPTISILLGIGASVLLNSKKLNKYLSFTILLVLIILSFAVSGNFIKDFFNINDRAIVSAGIAVDKLTPKDAKVIANYNGDTSFLYQTKRKGWPSFEKPVPQLIKMGADYLILVNPSHADLEIGKTYKIIDNTKEYVIFDLHKKP